MDLIYIQLALSLYAVSLLLLKLIAPNIFKQTNKAYLIVIVVLMPIIATIRGFKYTVRHGAFL